jgi:hypothetical protein
MLAWASRHSKPFDIALYATTDPTAGTSTFVMAETHAKGDPTRVKPF